jgi:hypothetical protein
MDVHAWFNTAFVAVNVALTIILASRSSMRSHERELAELKVKVDTMWMAWLKRGIPEGIEKGLMTLNSPLRLTPGSRDMFVHLADELRAFRTSKFPDLDEGDLALEIERQFGDRIIKEICIPNHISNQTCLLIATAIAKDKDHTLTQILDEYLPPRSNGMAPV